MPRLSAFILAGVLLPFMAIAEGTPAHSAHAPAPRTPDYTAMPTPETIHDLFLKWNVTLQTGTPEDMAKLYAEDGILLPTVSNDVRENRAEVADYFAHFQKLKPNGILDEEHIQILDENTAVNSGIYTFAITKDGKPQRVQARYTYVYEKIGDEWLIKDHHSSKMPEPVDPKPAGDAAAPASHH